MVGPLSGLRAHLLTLGNLRGLFADEEVFADGRVASVEEITVDEPCRRKGIGQALMREFEAWAWARECRLVALATRRAAAFYAAIGYEEFALHFRKLL